MQGKSFLVDLSRCTACRGCQVACKQWHKLPATETRNHGSHQNPMDLNFDTYKLVRFHEGIFEGALNWLFFPDQCRHCIDPPCMLVSSVDGAIIQDENTGAVIYTDKTAEEDFDEIKFSCPYNIPRKQDGGNLISKCDMCNDRVQNGLLPACVQACPTGAMSFGDREDILKLAEKRLAEVKKRYPKAVLVNPESVRVIVLAAYPPEDYYEYLSAEAGQRPLDRRSMLAKLGAPIKRMMG